MKVAVYTGSFNPLHKGHIAVVRYLLDNAGFDMVYLVVSPRNPFKEPSLEKSGEDRFRTASEAVERLGLSEKVKVDDIEMRMPSPSYTIRTLDALKERESENRFTLVVGGDNLHELLSWREGDRILQEYGVVVYPRDGYNIVHDCAVLKLQQKNLERLYGSNHKPLHIKLLKDAPPVNISSTRIRRMIAAGEDVSELVA